MIPRNVVWKYSVRSCDNPADVHIKPNIINKDQFDLPSINETNHKATQNVYKKN